MKCAQVRATANGKGRLKDAPLPEDRALVEIFKHNAPNTTHDSHCLPHEEQIKKWFDAGINGTAIHRALAEQFGFSGSYSSVRRRLKELRRENPGASCMLDFAPAEAAR